MPFRRSTVLKVKGDDNATGGMASIFIVRHRRDLSDIVEAARFNPMETKVDVRLPRELRAALERERLRMSKEQGTEVKTSFVVRSLLERALRPKRRSTSIGRAA